MAKADMSTAETEDSIVATVAYLASDVVYSIQQTRSLDTQHASRRLKELENRKESNITGYKPSEIVSLRHNAEPFLSVLETARQGQIVSTLTPSSTLVQSIPVLSRLMQYPVVIHVALSTSSNDYGDIAALRHGGFPMLQSFNCQEAQDIAVIAHTLALRTGKGVLHFYEITESIEAVPKVKDLLRGLISQELISKARQVDNDASIYLKKRQTIQSDPPLAEESAKPANDVNGSTPDGATGSEHSPTNGSASGTSLSNTSTVNGANVTPESFGKPIDFEISSIFESLASLTHRKYSFFGYAGSINAESVLISFGSNVQLYKEAIEESKSEEYRHVGFVTPYVYRPWSSSALMAVIPMSVKAIAVVEQTKQKDIKWAPMFLDVMAAVHASSVSRDGLKLLSNQLGYVARDTIHQALRGLLQNLQSDESVQNLCIGSEPDVAVSQELVPSLESAYLGLLHQLFNEKLHVVNASNEFNVNPSKFTSSPEYALGAIIARAERKRGLEQEIAQAVQENGFNSHDTRDGLSKWLLHAKESDAEKMSDSALLRLLQSDGSTAAEIILESSDLLQNKSQWLIASDAWSYDLGNSGLHHLIASGQNVNMLIIDNEPYSTRTATNSVRRKKDIGLYAMNYGNAYVASVAVYSSYTQVIHALLEADKFEGPSIVVAYLPYYSENDTALTVLQETKKAVDIGYWPLYRWTPHAEEDGENSFELDSERIKRELKEFLKRDNHVSQLLHRTPKLSASLESSYGSEVRTMQKVKAREALSHLLEGLSGPPMTILFASDNANAEGLARRLQRRAKSRGMKSTVQSMEEYLFEELANEENLVCVTSTAGQGEFPQNGRAFWDHIKEATDLDLSRVKYSVFALGDSHYWPRKEDKRYYNKPGKDLDSRLEILGAKRMVEVGLGDDQDPDGYQTAYAIWEPELWKFLGAETIEAEVDEPAPITNEDIKIGSNYLRGTIAEGLADESTGAIAATDQQLTKFHGTYMQDDRDLRDSRKEQGVEPAYMFMVRVRLPAGVCTPKQWLAMDSVSESYGNNTMKLTTRQTFQFHGIVKKKLRTAMRGINKALLDTLAACGDVNRNVMCSPCIDRQALHGEVQSIAQRISEHLLPKTSAYHEIWLQDKENDKKTLVGGEAVQDFEPMYGPTYLPRKHKITIAIPPRNDVDVYAHDIGMIAIVNDAGKLTGFNFFVGGGMGVTHNNKKTYPRLNIESPIGYVPKDKAHLVCEKIMLVQKDHGDRQNRKHARMKYTVDDHSTEWYKEQVEERLGWKLESSRPYHFESNIDEFGWVKDESGKWHFTMYEITRI